MFRTIAIIIGISNYYDDRISNLFAASFDAEKVARSLCNWGVHNNNIKLLIDSKATRSSILNAIRGWAVEKSTSNTKFIFYFAGHGSRTVGFLLESALLTYDSLYSDPIETGINMSELIKAVNRLNPTQSFLFFDACNLRLSKITNPLEEPLSYDGDLLDRSLLAASSAKALFCLLASGPLTAYENRISKKGIFTDILLKSIAKLRNTEHNCNYLATLIEKKLRKLKFPPPESYHIGQQSVWLLPRNNEEYKEVISLKNKREKLVHRVNLIAKIQDSILTSSIWLWGESGSGKTTVAKQFLGNSSTNSIYCSVPQIGHLSYQNIIEIIIEDIAAKHSLFANYSEQNSFDNIFNLIFSFQSNIILFIDHLDRLDNKIIVKLLNNATKSKNTIIFISRYLPPLQYNEDTIFVCQCPLMSLKEITILAKKYNIDTDQNDIKLLQLITRGNPLKLVQEMADVSNNIGKLKHMISQQEVQEAALAIMKCSGYIDENLFRNTFRLNNKAFSILEKFGLLVFDNNKFLPHDSLTNLIHIKTQYSVRGTPFTEYWVKQVELTPQNAWACRTLIESCIKYGIKSHYDEALNYAINNLLELKAWDLLSTLADFLIKSNCNLNCTLTLAENLVRISRYELSENLTNIILLNSKKLENLNNAKIIEAERLWWCGDYYNAKKLSHEVTKKTNSKHLISWAKLNIGIASFFEGNWPNATNKFTEVINFEGASPRIVAWGKSMLGTALGIRGIEIKKSQKLLASAEQILTTLNDFVGASIASNNLGEIMWKLGELRSALLMLSQSHQLALKMSNQALILETLRNLIQVRLRLNGPRSSELEELLQKFNKFIKFNKNIDFTEAMQLWNTLATVHAYRGEKEILKKYLDKVTPLTKGNLEYEIYTLTNTSFLQMFEKNESKSFLSLKKSVNLALSGHNILALKQIETDTKNVLSNFSKNSFKKHLDYIRKYTS